MKTYIVSFSVPDGKPVIDFVPDMPNVLIATGHEGSGLTLVSPGSWHQFVTVTGGYVLYYFLFSCAATHEIPSHSWITVVRE
jgi:hypothetical protein